MASGRFGFAFRTLRKNPAVTIPAIVALAVGIGANSAMFSVIDGVLLRPLPFANPERLVNVWETNQKRNIPQFPVAAGNYYDWRAQNTVFSRIGAFQPAVFNLQGTGEPERYTGALCDPGFFASLGVKPILGRLFTDQENEPGRDGVVLLGYSFWRGRFGADPKVVGRALVFNGRARVVIGVMPEGFSYPPQAVMWSPVALQGFAKTRRDYHTLRVIARLRDGVSLERARSDFNAISIRLDHDYPEMNKDEGIVVHPMLDDAVGKIRPALLVLMGAVGFVLLIACANVTNLLLAKAARRRHEIAMRVSLGARPADLIRQMLAESILLSSTGAGLGLLLAYDSIGALVSLAPANFPRLNEAALNWHAVAFTLGLAVVTGLLFGLAPAWHASKVELNAILKDGGRGSTTRNRVRDGLVVAQVAFTLVLLVGAGLLLRSFYEIMHVDGGFRPDHLMTMRLLPAPYKYGGHKEMQAQLARNILAKVGGLPGVTSAAVSTDIPLLGNPVYIMRFEGRPPVRVSEAPVVNYFAVSPNFFGTMGMRLVRGRTIMERDTMQTPLVAVVNQTLANLYFPHEDPIGKRLEVGFDDPPKWREIVGVVADVRSAGLDQDTPVQVYTAYMQDPAFANLPSTMVVLARTSPPPETLAASIKTAILSVDRSQPVYGVQAMTDVVSQSVAQQRLSVILLAFFAGAALFLASVGLYAVISYVVTQRTSEIGIRMALGAQHGQMLLFIEREGLRLVLAGIAIGVAAALILTRLMASLLFHVRATDLPTFAAVAAVLLLVSVVACYWPARRAARVDPLVALRHE